LKDKKRSPDQKLVYPAYWDDPIFGIAYKGAPVVGVTWYEANAYCNWLERHWKELEESRTNDLLSPEIMRLPTEMEWVKFAGGDQPVNRYPWDKSGEATEDLQEILKRANIDESNIKHTTPVGMYPLGASSLGLQDMAGDIWEWQANHSDKRCQYIGLRGGSWSYLQDNARVASRSYYNPNFRDIIVGFRVVCLPS
jgi:formylglycine-generating enzyme required for sulfatase activity